jgi:hypothetical protein
MKTTPPGRPRLRTRLARALGLDGNPLRRASDRAEAWIRIGLLAIFLIAAPMAASAAGAWAHHAGVTAGLVEAAPVHDLKTAAFEPALASSYLDQAGEARAGTRWERAASSARADAVLAAIMTLAFMALALLAALRMIRVFLTRRRLAAWATAWSKVGPQWSGGRT